MRASASAIGLGILVAAALAPWSSGCSSTSEANPCCAADADAGEAGDGIFLRAEFGLDTRPSNTTCRAPARPPVASGVKLAPVFPALTFTAPLGMYQVPGDASRWYVIEQAGVVKMFQNTGGVTTTKTVLDIASRVVSGGEAGLLGMAFHPRFAQNHQVYLSYTKAGGPAGVHSTISRMTSPDGGQTFDPATEKVLLDFDQPYSNHNGGHVAFGPDGFLYIGFGDGGSGGDPLGHGQNKNTLFGKILRIDVDNGTPYGIPKTNPFANGGGKPEIYAYGLRNPWRFSFDTETGALWCGDVGQNKYEEVDQIKLGGNYGWNTREGLHCYGAATCSNAGFVDPVVEYSHAVGQSITGGFVYRGKAIPSLVGSYVYGDYQSGVVWALAFDAVTGDPAPVVLNPAGPTYNMSSFGQDSAGEVYLVGHTNGHLYQLVPDTAAPTTDTFPKTLSATGCTEPGDAAKPAPGVLAYDVNSPLWSDGADKTRWLAIPDGQTIGVGADGDWDLPVGTMLLKTFAIGGKRIETRLLVRHEEGEWAGYSYEWNDAQTDATLLPSNKTKTVGAQSWSFPSRAECLRCHTAAAGRTLGLETGQLNGDFVYGSGRLANQLATLDHIGMFAASPGVPEKLPALAGLASSASLDTRARSYLHSNCSFCHRPSGGGQGRSDLRFVGSLKDSRTCDEAPENGELGIPQAKLLAPGDPTRSLISVRAGALDVRRMPPLATQIVDEAATKVLDEWIRSVGVCPGP